MEIQLHSYGQGFRKIRNIDFVQCIFKNLQLLYDYMFGRHRLLLFLFFLQIFSVYLFYLKYSKRQYFYCFDDLWRQFFILMLM